MTRDVSRRYGLLFLTLCVLSVSLVPKFLMVANYVIDPFTNSVVALAIETQRTGYVPVIPYSLQGYWQTHANFISLRTGIVSFFTIMSSVTGLSPYVVGSLPLIGIMDVIVGYIFGRALGSRFTGLAFALIFGFSWYPTLTGTNIGYQSYGSVFAGFIFFIVAKCAVGAQWSRKYILTACVMFIAMYETYYTAEFTTLVFCVALAIFSLGYRWLGVQAKSLKPARFLALFFAIVFLAFDTVEYGYLSGSASLRLFWSAISNYLGYVRAIIFRESQSIQAYRPYTNPFTKYFDLSENILMWSIILFSIVWFLYSLRKSRGNGLTERTRIVFIISFSFLFVFIMRLSLYGLLGKIAIGWIYTSLIPVVLAEIWLFPRRKPRLRYVLPLIFILLTVFRFSIIWTDQTMSFIGANYSPIINPGANWFANNALSGSIVSSNQISAQIFSTLAEHGKDKSISVNQFGLDVNRLTDAPSNLSNLFRAQGYNYVLFPRVFMDQPIFGGFWGPYVPPLGSKLQNFDNSTDFQRIYDDGMSFYYSID